MVALLLAWLIILTMKSLDRFLDLSPDLARPDNSHYKRYQIGVRIAALGIGMMVAGLVGDTIGVEVGEAVAAGGILPSLVGTGFVTLETGKLRTYDDDPQITAPTIY